MLTLISLGPSTLVGCGCHFGPLPFKLQTCPANCASTLFCKVEGSGINRHPSKSFKGHGAWCSLVLFGLDAFDVGQSTAMYWAPSRQAPCEASTPCRSAGTLDRLLTGINFGLQLLVEAPGLTRQIEVLSGVAQVHVMRGRIERSIPCPHQGP